MSYYVPEEDTDRFCDHTAERSLLHYMCTKEIYYYDIISRVSVNDLLSTDNRIFYSILVNIREQGFKTADRLLILQKAEEAGLVEDLGGDQYVSSILRMPSSGENLDKYITCVLEASTKYKLYKHLNKSVELIVANSKSGSPKSSEDLIGSTQGSIMSIALNKQISEEPLHVTHGLTEFIDSIRDERIVLSGISTGYSLLDERIDGLIKGTVLIIAARKKEGKSTLLSNMAVHSGVVEQKPLLYIDTEMPFEQWQLRVLSMMSGIEERIIRHGGFDQEVYDRLTKCILLLSKSKIYHHYVPGYSVDQIVSLYTKYKIKEKIELGIFDYIKEPDNDGSNTSRKEYQILGDVTTRLKNLAGQLDIPLITAVQLGRSGDVADSDKIARYGDIIAFWGLRVKEDIEDYPEFDGNTHGFYRLWIKDSRRGGMTPRVGIGYHFFKKTLKIREVAKHNQLIDLGNDISVVDETCMIDDNFEGDEFE